MNWYTLSGQKWDFAHVLHPTPPALRDFGACRRYRDRTRTSCRTGPDLLEHDVTSRLHVTM